MSTVKNVTAAKKPAVSAKAASIEKTVEKKEQDNRELKTEIKNLCENIKSLTNMMKWFLCAFGGALISFFFYVVQNGIFKK